MVFSGLWREIERGRRADLGPKCRERDVDLVGERDLVSGERSREKKGYRERGAELTGG